MEVLEWNRAPKSSKKGRKEFVVLPFDEIQHKMNLTEDHEDWLDPRKAREKSSGADDFMEGLAAHPIHP